VGESVWRIEFGQQVSKIDGYWPPAPLITMNKRFK